VPRKKQTHARIVFDLVGFAASEVGIKHQPFFVIVLEQNNSLVRLTVFVNGRDDHCRRVGQPGVAGLSEPTLK
jgi:hypothetical protein